MDIKKKYYNPKIEKMGRISEITKIVERAGNSDNGGANKDFARPGNSRFS
jgi:hypothetical protein